MKLNRIFILGACSITFLASCGCSNNNDQKVLDEVNKILSDNASSINTCHDAVKKIEENKIELNEHKFSNVNYEFVYDSKAKQFVIMEGDKIVRTSSEYIKSDNTLDYFKSVFVYNPNSKYSQYLDKRAEVPEQLLITTGFDIGDHIDIPNIAYTNLSNNAHDVIVRTYSDYFSVLAPLDTVHHYEIATNVIVTDIGTLDMHASTAYVNAKNGYINFAAGSSTDFFEVDEDAKKVEIDISKNAAFYAAVNIDKTKSGEKIKVTLPSASVSNADELETAVKAGKVFIRLSNDITYSTPMNLNESFCLDLAGYKIKFEGEGVTDKAAIDVVSGQSLYILDSQGVLDNNSGIDLHDCHISVNSTSKDSPATLMINGGKITQTVTSNHEYSAAVQCIGNITMDSEDTYASNFIMYGGKIEARMSEDSSKDSTCVTSYGKGANVSIVYGNLISDAGCIACNPGETGYYLGGSTLTISGGHFTAGLKVNATCIEYGENVDLIINGGTFTGDTCLTVKRGKVNITNTTFNALGQYREHIIGADGSAIYVYSSEEKLTLEIADSFIYSNFAYILSAQDGAMADVTFNSGLYSYYLDGATNLPEKGVSVTVIDQNNFIQHSL
ncbi:MAG: hypothetical protein MJ214_05245 [Bacilli bacterium]|nr:hypothetical protein [Bacilli bacterium]